MKGELGGIHGSTLRDYLHVVRRRKWIILQAIVLVPAVAVFLSMRQQKLYESSAQVLLSYQNLASALTGVPESPTYVPAADIRQTQAELAMVPAVSERTARALGLPSRPAEVIRGETSVSASAGSDMLFVSTTDPDPALAPKIATEYARQYVNYRHELDTAELASARKSVQRRIDRMEASGSTNSALYRTLVDSAERLRAMESLETSNAQVVRDAQYAYKVAPRPLRNGILGFALGLILGIGFAFLREALDTRVRSAEEVGESLGLPLVARLPEPPRRLRREDRLTMLVEPNANHAEAFRMLRTNLDFVRIDREVRTIMVTSAVENEGKSTTAANLAVALARAGQRVGLIDLDLRKPFLHRFFDLDPQPGLTQVALGHTTLREALVSVPIVADPTRNPALDWNGNGAARVEGVLEVLPAGPIPPNVDEFLGSRVVADILGQMRSRVDVVIIDSTPLLVVGDAMTLTGSVDGLLVVARLNLVRRPMLRELHRVLEASPAQKLGFVITGAGSDEDYYGYGGYAYRHDQVRSTRREPVA
jgi:polysaccharide biosynthesis transport protein